MQRAILFLLAFALLAPSNVSLAQAPAGRGHKEVERGLYLQAMIGTKIFVMPPAGQGVDAPMVMGMSMGVAAGYDVLDILQVEAFFSGAQIRAPSTYGGLGEPNDPHGDFSAFLAGVKGRFTVLGVPDNQGVRRLHITVHGGGGMLLTAPVTVMEMGRPAVLGGGGMHYFTRLRHFTVGIEVDAVYGLGANALALYPQARLSYTF